MTSTDADQKILPTCELYISPKAYNNYNSTQNQSQLATSCHHQTSIKSNNTKSLEPSWSWPSCSSLAIASTVWSAQVLAQASALAWAWAWALLAGPTLTWLSLSLTCLWAPALLSFGSSSFSGFGSACLWLLWIFYIFLCFGSCSASVMALYLALVSAPIYLECSSLSLSWLRLTWLSLTLYGLAHFGSALWTGSSYYLSATTTATDATINCK